MVAVTAVVIRAVVFPDYSGCISLMQGIEPICDHDINVRYATLYNMSKTLPYINPPAAPRNPALFSP